MANTSRLLLWSVTPPTRQPQPQPHSRVRDHFTCDQHNCSLACVICMWKSTPSVNLHSILYLSLLLSALFVIPCCCLDPLSTPTLPSNLLSPTLVERIPNLTVLASTITDCRGMVKTLVSGMKTIVWGAGSCKLPGSCEWYSTCETGLNGQVKYVLCILFCCSDLLIVACVRWCLVTVYSAAAPPQHPQKMFLPRETAKFIDMLKYGEFLVQMSNM